MSKHQLLVIAKIVMVTNSSNYVLNRMIAGIVFLNRFETASNKGIAVAVLESMQKTTTAQVDCVS